MTVRPLELTAHLLAGAVTIRELHPADGTTAGDEATGRFTGAGPAALARWAAEARARVAPRSPSRK